MTETRDFVFILTPALPVPTNQSCGDVSTVSRICPFSKIIDAYRALAGDPGEILGEILRIMDTSVIRTRDRAVNFLAVRAA